MKVCLCNIANQDEKKHICLLKDSFIGICVIQVILWITYATRHYYVICRGTKHRKSVTQKISVFNIVYLK